MPAKFKVPAAANLSVCTDPAQAPSSCYDPEDMVTVIVQYKNNTEEYKIFRGLLAWHSSYFAAALKPKSGFYESMKDRYELSTRHDVFKAFCCWLYTGRLMDLTIKRTEAKEPEDVYLSTELLCAIWAFADFRGIPALGNAVIDMLHEATVAKWQRGADAIAYVYSITLEDSKLRAFVVQYSIATETWKSLRTWSGWQTVDFLYDVMPKMGEKNESERLGRDKATRMNRCQLHDHSGPGGRLGYQNQPTKRPFE